MKLRCRTAQLLQNICRVLQCFPGQELADLLGKRPVQSARCRYQHGLAGDRIAQGAACVQQHRQPDRLVSQTDGRGQQFLAYPVPGRCAEDPGQYGVGGGGAQKQGPGVGVRIKDAVDHRYAAGQQPQTQHAARHGTGDRKQQHGQPQQMRLPAEYCHGQQNTCGYFYRAGAQKPKTRQKDRHRIGTAQESTQQASATPQGDACKTRRAEQHQIIHDAVEHEHAVHIHHRHGPSPFPEQYYRAGPPEKPSQKGQRKGGRKRVRLWSYPSYM